MESKSSYHKRKRFAVATSTYENALQVVESLSIEDQKRLLAELTARTAKDAGPEKKHSIMELRGLGAEIWEGIDAQEYVRNERAS
jgi:hypothetical protein